MKKQLIIGLMLLTLCVYAVEVDYVVVPKGTDPSSYFNSGIPAPTNAVIGDLMRYSGSGWVPTSAFVYRGDNGTQDFVTADIVFDNTYHSYSLTNKIPAGAKYVLYFSMLNASNIYSMILKPTGQTNLVALSLNVMTVANNVNFETFIVPIIYSNRSVDVRINTTNTHEITQFRIQIMGWGY